MLAIFGQRLRALRRGHGLTQTKLADALNERFDSKPHPNTEAQLGKWELGLRSPSVPELVKLATYFNVSLDFLVGRSDDNIKDLAKALASTSEIKFNEVPLEQADKNELFELIKAFMLGKQGRAEDDDDDNRQEELHLDFGPDNQDND